MCRKPPRSRATLLSDVRSSHPPSPKQGLWQLAAAGDSSCADVLPTWSTIAEHCMVSPVELVVHLPTRFAFFRCDVRADCPRIVRMPNCLWEEHHRQAVDSPHDIRGARSPFDPLVRWALNGHDAECCVLVALGDFNHSIGRPTVGLKLASVSPRSPDRPRSAGPRR